MATLAPTTSVETRLARVESQLRALRATNWTDRASATTPDGEDVSLAVIATAPAAASAAQDTADTAATAAATAGTAAASAADLAATANAAAADAIAAAAAAQEVADAAEAAAGAVTGDVAAAQTAADDAATQAANALAAAQAAATTGGNAQQQADLAAAAAAAAQQAADDAGTSASQADADAAAAAATAAQAVADAAAANTLAASKITTYRQDTAPTGTIPTGSLWVDTANGERQSRWNGSSWTLIQDAAIAAARTQADTALTTASGRNHIYAQATAPTGSQLTAGDLWIDTANGRRLSTWSGTAWTLQQFGSAVFAAQSINAGDILVNGSILAALLDANAINGKTITGATLRTAASGQRVQIDSTNGLVGYNSGGTAVTTISPSTGALTATGATISGLVQSAATGARITLGQVGSVGSLQMYPPANSAAPAALRAETFGATAATAKVVTLDFGSILSSANFDTGKAGPKIALSGDLSGDGTVGYKFVTIDADNVNITNPGLGPSQLTVGTVQADYGVNGRYLSVLSSTAASATSTDHAVSVGAPTGPNLAIDRSQIVPRNAGVLSTLTILGGLTVTGVTTHASPAFTVVAAASGWTNVSNGFGGFKTADGMIGLRGWISNVNTFTPAGGEVICTLPAALRPLGSLFCSIPVSVGQTMIQLNILTTGVISIARPHTQTIGSGAFFSFDTVLFRP